MNKTMFLLEFDCANMECDLPDVPEVTLWKTFDEAFAVALDAAAACCVKIDMAAAIINKERGELWFPDFCEIMPISLSKPGKITWMGKKWVSRPIETPACEEEVTNE